MQSELAAEETTLFFQCRCTAILSHVHLGESVSMEEDLPTLFVALVRRHNPHCVHQSLVPSSINPLSSQSLYLQQDFTLARCL